MQPVAVIILNWNGEKLLKEFLPQVIANTNPEIGRVIVADNGSTDGSIALLEKEFPEVGIIRFNKNHGFAGGYNLALESCRDYKYALLLNSDVAPAPQWLDHLYEFMETHPNVAACQPKLLSYKQPQMLEYAGACGGLLDKNGYAYCRGRIFATCEEDCGQYDTPMEIFWASGAAMMVRTQVFFEAGGLDEKFFAHMEEIDLCWRILLLGYKIMAVPQSAVRHLGGGSLPASNPQKTYLNFRNNLLMMHKNLPDAIRNSKIRRRMILDGIAGAKMLLTFDFANVKAIIKAHRDFRKLRRDYTTHPSTDLLSPLSVNILTNYYLHSRHHFSDLK